jgi:hypothetical protein
MLYSIISIDPFPKTEVLENPQLLKGGMYG